MPVDVWLERIFQHEGGLSMTSTDPGNWTGGVVGNGLLKGTKYGIAANTYPDLQIRNLTREQAAEIYVRDYLAPLKADKMPAGLVFSLLDFAVNSGPLRAIKRLQGELGVQADGHVGPVTLAAINARSESDLVMLLTASRLEFMAGLRNFDVSGKGWVLRLARNLRYAAEDT